jgi:hypothetical protein
MSALFYTLQIRLFHRPADTLFYMLQDLAFVPIQVLIVTLIINQLLSQREKQEMQSKLNMVIGAFYSEMGVELLKICLQCDAHTERLRPLMQIGNDWTEKEFTQAKRQLGAHVFAITCRQQELRTLKTFLSTQRAFLLALLENPNLMEHAAFTDLLWAVSHLMEELAYREQMEGLPASDYAHLAGDLQRAYMLVLQEWLAYTNHLRADYPYIFSLIVRMNPYNAQASPLVLT